MHKQVRTGEVKKAYLVELIYLAHTMHQAVVQLLAAVCGLSGVLSKLPQILNALTQQNVACSMANLISICELKSV